MDWIRFAPELTLLLAAVVCLAMACLPPEPRRNRCAALVLAALAAAAGIASVSQNGDMFNHAYRIDLYSQVFKALLSVGFFLIVLICGDFQGVASERQPEAYLLMSVCTLAMMMLASSVHLLAVFLSLELSSYSLYLLVFLRRDRHWGMTAGLRYFLVGAGASAVTLFGLALVYAAAGTLYIERLAGVMPNLLSQPAVAAGLVLTLAGFFFKLAVFPFHFWAPDAYQGAPNPVAAFIASVSKVAAVAVLLRLVALAQGDSDLFIRALMAISVISMTVGNLAAIAQTDFKRLMAFSSIAHAGYLLLGMLCMSSAGYAAAIFYAAAVMLLKFTCFMVMISVAVDGRNLQISELAGLHERSPLLALAFMVALFGLGGIPPTIGFTGKLLIFTAAVEQGYLILVLIAMANVVVSLYYYLSVLKAAYLDAPAEKQAPLTPGWPIRAAALAMVALIVGLGFYPTAFFDWVQHAAVLLP